MNPTTSKNDKPTYLTSSNDDDNGYVGNDVDDDDDAQAKLAFNF